MRSKIGPLDEGDHQPAYDVKRPVPHNGPWFLILDLYRCQTSRDVEVNLQDLSSPAYSLKKSGWVSFPSPASLEQPLTGRGPVGWEIRPMGLLG